jgi:hypothetical protein
MLVTKDWAYIHFPRTGGTWAGQALHKACLADGREHLYLPIHAERWRAAVLYHRDIPILGCVRNPLDWYVSKYEYRHWVQNQRPDSPMGTWPTRLEQMTFSEWLPYAVSGDDWSEMLHSDGARSYQGISWPPNTGWMTIYLWYWFSLAPWQPDLTPLLTPHSWGKVPTTRAEYEEALRNVTFLRTESLREDMDRWLEVNRFKPEARKAAREHPNANITKRRRNKPWQNFYSAEDEELVRTRERLLFDIFGDSWE